MDFGVMKYFGWMIGDELTLTMLLVLASWCIYTDCNQNCIITKIDKRMVFGKYNLQRFKEK